MQGEIFNMNTFIISGFSDEISESIPEQFETLKKLGISYFEPRGINGKNIADLTDDEIFILLGAMKKYGIRASSIGSPIGKIGIRDDFEPHFEKFKRVVEIAKMLGTEYIRIFSFYIPEGQNPDLFRGEVTLRLVKMITYAKQEGVVLLHENEKGIYGDTAQRCFNLFDALYSSNFKAVFDPANFVQCGEDTKKAYDMLKPYIAYMHIKDATLDGNVVPSGLGNGNIEHILSDLASDYIGFLSLEPHLGSFSGLENLETDDTMTKLKKSSAEKFELAYNSLKTILERI